MGNKRNSVEWYLRYSRLVEYSALHGHCFVPRSYACGDGFKLGIWVNEQRRRRRFHSPEEALALESLPHWTWDATDARWRTIFVSVENFSKKNGHLVFPPDARTPDGVSLLKWIELQRSKSKAGELSKQRLERLQTLAGW